MADNIEIGEITLPLWATETTLSAVLNAVDIGSSLNAELVEQFKQDNTRVTDILSAISTNTSRTDDLNDDTATATQSTHKKVEGMVTATAAGFSSAVGKLDNMTDPVGTLKAVAKSMGSGLKSGMKFLESNNTMFRDFATNMRGLSIITTVAKYGKILVGIGMAVLAFAGFQVAKMADLLKVQKNMIEAGAYFSENIDTANEDLNRSLIGAGLSMTALSEIALSNGDAMVALGGNASMGVRAFTKLSKKLRQVSGQVGDYGLSLTDLHKANADFISARRKSFTGDMKLDSSQDKLISEFDKLMIEATAVAGLTGMKRSDYLKDITEAMSNPKWAAAIAAAELNDPSGKAAESLRLARRDLTVVSSSFGPDGKKFADVVAGSMFIFSKNNNMKNFTLEQAVAGTSLAPMLGAMSKAQLKIANTAIQNGEFTGAMMTELFMSLGAKTNARMTEVMAKDGSTAESIQNVMAIVDTQSRLLKRYTDAMKNGLTDEALEAAAALAEIGKLNVTSNNIDSLLLEAQRAMTMNLDTLNRVAGGVGDGLKGLADFLGITPDVEQSDYTVEDLDNMSVTKEYRAPVSMEEQQKLLKDTSNFDIILKGNTIYIPSKGIKMNLNEEVDKSQTGSVQSMQRRQLANLSQWKTANVSDDAKAIIQASRVVIPNKVHGPGHKEVLPNTPAAKPVIKLDGKLTEMQGQFAAYKLMIEYGKRLTMSAAELHDAVNKQYKQKKKAR